MLELGYTKYVAQGTIPPPPPTSPPQAKTIQLEEPPQISSHVLSIHTAGSISSQSPLQQSHAVTGLPCCHKKKGRSTSTCWQHGLACGDPATCVLPMKPLGNVDGQQQYCASCALHLDGHYLLHLPVQQTLLACHHRRRLGLHAVQDSGCVSPRQLQGHPCEYAGSLALPLQPLAPAAAGQCLPALCRPLPCLPHCSGNLLAERYQALSGS